MKDGNTSPGIALLILGSFILLALGVSQIIEHRLKQQEHQIKDKAWEKQTHIETKLNSQPSLSKKTNSNILEIDQHVRPSVSSESGMYHAQPTAGINDIRRDGAKVRRLAEFYARRAYPGAPPYIPHPVNNSQVISDQCLSCHGKGGYVQMYNAYAPVSPHPEKHNCRQCHVTQAFVPAFVESNWIQPTLPKRGQSAMGGSPPRIPHTMQLRENCLACHSGPSAVEEIRVSHPQRENCRQCHVPQTTTSIFTSDYGVEGDAH